mgnify:CR=1 FL=1
MADDDEIILSELSDDELVLQMHDDLYDGLKEEIEEAVNILIERGWTPYDILTKALVAGMTIVGADFRDGILFVPEVLLAANAMKAGMFILKPLLVETGAPRMGKMVIGTVKGDIHDIGKNLVGMMMDYMLPNKVMSWKEAWEVYFEQAGGALFKDLSRYGIRMPKYSDVIVKEKEHVSHQAWWIFYNFGHAAGFHTWIPTDEEMDWLSEKYPDNLFSKPL